MAVLIDQDKMTITILPVPLTMVTTNENIITFYKHTCHFHKHFHYIVLRIHHPHVKDDSTVVSYPSQIRSPTLWLHSRDGGQSLCRAQQLSLQQGRSCWQSCSLMLSTRWVPRQVEQRTQSSTPHRRPVLWCVPASGLQWELGSVKRETWWQFK